MTFVVSLRLGKPATIDPVRRRLDAYPTLRFKLDPTSEWTDELIAELVETGAVDSVDFKGYYKGTVVDQPPDPDLYRRVVEAFPDAWIEDPALTDETRPVLAGHEDRITWDAPIHSIADIEALPFPPKMVNVKPSRFGSLQGAAATATTTSPSAASAPTAAASSSSARAGGRSSTWRRSSIPTRPNDVAPVGYNRPRSAAGPARQPARARRRARRAFAGGSRNMPAALQPALKEFGGFAAVSHPESRP